MMEGPPEPLQAGRTDPDWIRECIDLHQQDLVGYTASLLNDPDRARDVVQDAFLALCRQSRDQVGGRVRPWLFTVCRNRAFDLLRKERPMTSINHTTLDNNPAPSAPPSAGLEQEEAGASLLRLLDALPHNQREVIRLKFLHELSYREISAITHLSTGNIGFLIHTGLKTLRSRCTPPGATV
jgi:RNA polymerase sigma-70 factor (ECF subfamily)